MAKIHRIGISPQHALCPQVDPPGLTCNWDVVTCVECKRIRRLRPDAVALDDLAPGVLGCVKQVGNVCYVPILHAEHRGDGAVSAWLDTLATRDYRFPTVLSDVLEGMLERRGYRLTLEWDETQKEWAKVWRIVRTGQTYEGTDHILYEMRASGPVAIDWPRPVKDVHLPKQAFPADAVRSKLWQLEGLRSRDFLNGVMALSQYGPVMVGPGQDIVQSIVEDLHERT